MIYILDTGDQNIFYSYEEVEEFIKVPEHLEEELNKAIDDMHRVELLDIAAETFDKAFRVYDFEDAPITLEEEPEVSAHERIDNLEKKLDDILKLLTSGATPLL